MRFNPLKTQFALLIVCSRQVDLSSQLRDQMQGPLRVSSARRCDHHNDQVSPAKNKKNGVHTLGQASDILISGERAMLLFEKARQIGFSGIGLSQRGDHASRFVHLSIRSPMLTTKSGLEGLTEIHSLSLLRISKPDSPSS